MADFVKLEERGYLEMQRALAALQAALPMPVLRSALTVASRPIERAARRNLKFWLKRSPSDRRSGGRAPGDLWASVKGGKIRRFRRYGKTGVLVVGPSLPKGSIGWIFEHGTFRQRQRPFLRPAWDAHRATAHRLFTRRVEELLARRARAKARRP